MTFIFQKQNRRSRYCKVCGKHLTSQSFGQRKPENKMLLCQSHLQKKRMQIKYNSAPFTTSKNTLKKVGGKR
jgi:ribosomal protein L44E